MYTYRDLIRKYSRDILSGHADRDLSPRKRRMTAVLLNLASNAGHAAVAYPPTDGDRQMTCKYLGEIVWDARPLVEATAPAAADDFGISLDLALTILRNL